VHKNIDQLSSGGCVKKVVLYQNHLVSIIICVAAGIGILYNNKVVEK